MGCEMSPKLEQQQKLISQSPTETTQAAKSTDSTKRRKKKRLEVGGGGLQRHILDVAQHCFDVLLLQSFICKAMQLVHLIWVHWY